MVLMVLSETEPGFQLGPPPPVRPMKPETNTKYSKIFAGMAKDTAPNKVWGSSKQWRVTAWATMFSPAS